MSITEINKTARIAGVLYLAMIPFALFGVMWPSTLYVSGNAATTASNIMASKSLFTLSILSALLIQLGHIWLVLVLYKLLKAVNKNHALLMVILFLISVPIAMLSELNRFAALLLLSDAEYLTVFTTGQLQTLMMFFLDLREQGVFIATIFWGLWLFPMGYLIFKSGYIPKILGVFLMIGCFGYLIDYVIFFLIPDFGTSIALFTGFGEQLFPLWLLIKGVNVEEWEKRAIESA
jgi:hypothetical protein